MNAREQARFDVSNAAKMGEWNTASHVELQPKSKKPATPAPPIRSSSGGLG